MSALPLLVLLGALVLATACVVLLATHPRPLAPDVVRAARRHEAVVSVAALVVSVVATLAVLSLPAMPLSTGLRSPVFAAGAAVAPYIAAVLLCLVRAVGELTWPRPRGAVRTAPLVRRTVRDVGGWRLVVLAATAGAGLLAVVVFGATSTPDGQRVARAVVDHGDGVVSWGSAGPYPGWHYGVPIAVALVVVLGAVLLALRAVTRRPPLPHVGDAHDGEVRRVAAARVLAGAQLWTGTGLGITGLVATLALRSTGHLTGAIASGALGVALVLGSVAVAATAVPGPRERHAGAPVARVDGVVA